MGQRSINRPYLAVRPLEQPEGLGSEGLGLRAGQAVTQQLRPLKILMSCLWTVSWIRGSSFLRGS